MKTRKIKLLILISILFLSMIPLNVSAFEREVYNFDRIWYHSTIGFNKNGDGQLIYPGPDGLPYSSVRFETIRDGIEDYEYLHMLQSLVDELRRCDGDSIVVACRRAEELLSTIREQIVKSPKQYTRDPDELLRFRDLIAEEIVGFHMACQYEVLL